MRSVWSECSVCSWRLSSVSLAVQQTTACSKLITSQGRGRFFIRLMLMRRTLGNVIKHMLHTNRVIEVSRHSSDNWKLFFTDNQHHFFSSQWYCPNVAILRNEEFVGEFLFGQDTLAVIYWLFCCNYCLKCLRTEPFLSLSMVLSEMNFKISIEVWTACPLHLLYLSLRSSFLTRNFLFVTLISELQLLGWKLAASGTILMFSCIWFTCMCMKSSCWTACCKPCLCFRCVKSMKLFPVESWGWCSG